MNFLVGKTLTFLRHDLRHFLTDLRNDKYIHSERHSMELKTFFSDTTAKREYQIYRNQNRNNHNYLIFVVLQSESFSV